MSTVPVTGNLIDGHIVTDAQETIAVWNPADLSQQVGAVPALGATEIDLIFAAAQHGFETWSATGLLQRGAVLAAAALEIRRRSEELTEIVVKEMGKTQAEAAGEVVKSAEFFEYYAAMSRQPFGELLADVRPNTYVMVRREPLGVVLLITPWNDPFLTPARKLAPALLAGNAVVIKPATETPLITLALASILNDAGLPAGVLGTVTGRGSAIGDHVLAHPSLAAVSFTGSTEVGLRVQRALAGRQVRVQTEMGGKNAAVVLQDADLELAADCIAASAFGQTGQRCTATSRLIVVEPVAEELIAKVAQRVERLVVGPGGDPATTTGPLVSAAQRDEVQGFVDRAVGEGAVVVAGKTEVPERLGHGAFVAPVAMRVTRDHEIWSREVFGPVLSVLVVAHESEAIASANDTAYGLSSAVFTSDLGAAHRFIERVQTGQVSVNQPTSGWDIHHPFGGFGESGSPFKEQGREAIAFYTRIKTAAVRYEGR